MLLKANNNVLNFHFQRTECRFGKCITTLVYQKSTLCDKYLYSNVYIVWMFGGTFCKLLTNVFCFRKGEVMSAFVHIHDNIYIHNDMVFKLSLNAAFELDQ